MTYSYLAEAQLFSSAAERARLLRAPPHHIRRYAEPPERQAPDHTPLPPQLSRAEPQAQAAIAAVAQALSALEAAQAETADGPTSSSAARHRSSLAKDAATRRLVASTSALRALLHESLEPLASAEQAHTRWRAVHHEVLATVLAAARTLDDAGLVARYALLLATAREAWLPRGTPGLADLYAAHAGALSRMLREGRVPPPARQDAAKQATTALAAAVRIRTCCFGDDHPLVRSTVAAWAAANERTERNQS